MGDAFPAKSSRRGCPATVLGCPGTVVGPTRRAHPWDRGAFERASSHLSVPSDQGRVDCQRGSVFEAKTAEDLVGDVGINLAKVREVESNNAINDLAVGGGLGLPGHHARRRPLLGNNRDGPS